MNLLHTDSKSSGESLAHQRASLHSSRGSALPQLLGIEEQHTLRLAGLRTRIHGLPYEVIPACWDTFSPYRGWLPTQVDRRSYGVLLEAEGNEGGFDYFTAVEVENFDTLNSDWDRLEIPAQRYAVFPHKDHVSTLRETLHSIFSHSLPTLNLDPLRHAPGVPLVLERYEASFDLSTGWGGIQVRVPLSARTRDPGRR